MSLKYRCLVVFMMMFSLVNVAYSKSEQYHRIVNLTDIVDDGDQIVKFKDKKGECYYFGKAKIVSVENFKIFGMEIPDAPKTKRWDLTIEKKVCEYFTYDKILYVVPDEKTIHGRHDSVLIPAGTDFLLFSSEEERKAYFYK
ncbi:hypothetical protein FM788_16130 [Salmonella enterica]|nr:hypothetical protein [Salmonella enterica]